MYFIRKGIFGYPHYSRQIKNKNAESDLTVSPSSK